MLTMLILFVGACKNEEPKKEEVKAAVNSRVPGLVTSAEELKALSKTGDLVLYCRSGNRSAMAQKLLAARFGIENTINLRGGVMMWTD